MTLTTQTLPSTAPTSSNTMSNVVPEVDDKPEKKKKNNGVISTINQRKIAQALIDGHSEQLKHIEGEVTLETVITHIFGDIEDTPNPTTQSAKRQRGNKKPMNPNKLALIRKSKIARAVIDGEPEKLEGLNDDWTINNVIKFLFYPAGEFKTFKEWKTQGYSLKGQKGYPIWGRKRQMSRTHEDTGEISEYEAFPLAYIFHESQATKITENTEYGEA